MDAGSYIKKRNELLSSFNCAPSIGEDEKFGAKFNLVSASLFNFLPVIAYESHRPIFNNIHLHKKLSILEQSHFETLEFVDTEFIGSDTVQVLRNKPTIICTFHLGSYRVLNLLLAKEGIPFSLVIGKEVMEQEGQKFRDLFNKLSGNKTGGEFGLINAEAPASGLQMLKELKRGRSLVLYIDGNTGAGNLTPKNENNCIIDFLGQQLYARKGIAYLAHMAGVPIIVAASYRKSWETIGIKFFEPIYPRVKDRNEFAIATTQHIYDLVSTLIRENPEQWEAWLYIHKSAKIINLNSPDENKKHRIHGEKAVFNSTLFGIFKIDGIPFLLKKQGYDFYEIGPDLYRTLVTCTGQPAGIDFFGEILFKQLWHKGVLTNALS